MQLNKIRESRQLGAFIIDIIMILLLLVNLSFIMFDWAFSNRWFQDLIASIHTGFFEFYRDQIHPDFLLYDLFFVGIFLSEFLIRWGLAIKNQRYHRWFFYPFIHWYDILGLIPVGSMRFLRLLRIVGILHRLHRRGVVDLTNNPVFDFFTRYSNILVDEVTDRVVLKVLHDVKSEVEEGAPLVDQLVEDVLRPQQEQLVDWLSWRVRKVAGHNLDAYKEQIGTYVDRRIKYAVATNKEISRLEQIPFLGSYFTETLEKAISEIVYNVIQGTIRDLASVDNRLFLREMSDIFFEDVVKDETDKRINKIISKILTQCMDVLIQRVKIQQWKLEEHTPEEIEEEHLQEEKLHERLRKEL